MRTIAMASLLGFAAFAHAQIDSGFNLHLTNGAQVKVPILVDSAGSELLRYDLDSGLMTLEAGDVIGGDYSQPLFCFEFGDPQAEPVVLDVVDANGHTIMFDVGLGSDLKYRTADDEVSLSVPSSAQCFFKDPDGVFGLFGKVSSGARANDGCNSDPESCLFSSAFAAYPELSIEYANISGNAPGDPVEYDIIVTNTGDADANDLALQEVFPSNPNVYSAVLTEGEWQCIDDAQGFCPDPNGDQSFAGIGPLRFQGLQLPAGAGMVFHVIRNIPADETQAGNTIHLHAGVVNGAGNTAENDVAEAQINIEGNPAAIAYAAQPTNTVLGNGITAAGGDPIVVQVLDSNGTLVTDHNSGQVQIELHSSDGSVVRLEDYKSVVNGEVTFTETELSTDDSSIVEGQGYRLKAISTEFDSQMSDSFEITAN